MNFGEDLDFSAVCRTCLGKRDLNPLFKKSVYPKRFSKTMPKVTGLKVGINDGLPQNICIKCLKHIKASIIFRMNCRRAEDKCKVQTSYINFLVNKYKDLDSNEDTGNEMDAAENSEMVIKTETHEEELEELYADSINLLPVDLRDIISSVNEFEKKYCIVPSVTHDYITESEKDPQINCKVWGKETVECPTCNKTLQRASLKFHTKVKHAGLGPVCDHCGKKFSNNLRLKEHMRSKHGYEKFKCSQCTFQSATTIGLTNHERRHRGEKPFVCEVCGASFHAAYLMAQHKQSHRTERLLKCTLCPASFKSNNGLHTHRATCHGVARHSCTECNRSYSCRHYLVRHMRTVHRYEGVVPVLTHSRADIETDRQRILPIAENKTDEVHIGAVPVQPHSWANIESDRQRILPTAGNRSLEVDMDAELVQAESGTDI